LIYNIRVSGNLVAPIIVRHWLFVRVHTPTFPVYSYGMTSHHMTSRVSI